MSPASLPLRFVFGGAVLLGGLGPAAPVLAQSGLVPVVSQPVVQSVPGGEGMKLNDALNRLAKDPRDVAALLDAGKASLDLGDVDAAIGFFQRASTLSPGNPRAKAGLAGAYVLKRDPFSAIPLFNEAEQAGPIDPARMADRGLAYDLVGDNQTAQRYYRESLAAAPGDETLRRLALSQAIIGDRRGMEATLSPLLQKQDKAAWRTRAFALAILGYGEEAEGIARQSMPADRATAMSAYLRYMPRLTPPQQAAAGNLGHFPRAAEVGVDDPRVAQYARPRSALAAASSTPVAPPKGKGKNKRPGNERPVAVETKPPVQAAVAPPEPKVGREVNGEPVQLAAAELPPKAVAQPKPQPQPGQALALAQPVPVPVQAAPVLLPQAKPGFASLEPVSANPVPGFDLKQVGPVTAAEPAPVQAAPAKPPPKQPSLEEVFADFVPSSAEAEPAAGAVDVRKLPPAPKFALAKEPAVKEATAKEPAGKDAKGKAAKETAKETAKDAKLADCAELPSKGKAGAKGKASAKSGARTGAKAGSAVSTQCKDGKPVKGPTHPSRIWVQIATGKNKKALAFDWGKFAKADPDVFKSRKGYTSAWGQTNRLLTGPFESEAAANAYVAKLKKAGVAGAFIWNSPAGQVVDTLP